MRKAIKKTLGFITVMVMVLSLGVGSAAPMEAYAGTTTNTEESTKTKKDKAKIKYTYTVKKVTKKTTKTKEAKKKASSSYEKSSTKTKTTNQSYYSSSGYKHVEKEVKTVEKWKYTKGKKKYKYTKTVTTTTRTTKYSALQKEITVDEFAPKADSKLKAKFKAVGAKASIDTTISYDGLGGGLRVTLVNGNLVDTRTAYHEMGHFLGSTTNSDATTEWKNIFNSEKGKFRNATDSDYNAKYAKSNCYEYFACAYASYVLNNSKLKSNCPKTYNYIKAQLNKL